MDGLQIDFEGASITYTLTFKTTRVQNNCISNLHYLTKYWCFFLIFELDVILHMPYDDKYVWKFSE